MKKIRCPRGPRLTAWLRSPKVYSVPTAVQSAERTQPAKMLDVPIPEPTGKSDHVSISRPWP